MFDFPPHYCFRCFNSGLVLDVRSFAFDSLVKIKGILEVGNHVFMDLSKSLCNKT